MESTTYSNESKFAVISLEHLRKRLLDLTNRNRLLNFKHGKTGSIRVIDELPDQLFELFLDVRPVDVWEFQEEFPEYLRHSVHIDEGKYLKRILKIIEEHEEDIEYV